MGNKKYYCRPPFWGSVSCAFMQLVLPSVATPGGHIASFNWLLWNQILLFEELSGGDTWRRICRGRSESVRGGGGCFFAGRQLGEAVSELPGDILRGGFFCFWGKAVRDIGRRRLVLERFSIREAERVLEG